LRLAVTLPKLSIAAKLYAILALMAITTVVRSVAAIAGTRSNAVLSAKAVADGIGSVAGRIRAQVDQFFERLSAWTFNSSRMPLESGAALCEVPRGSRRTGYRESHRFHQQRTS
jgi:hypothetical protein